MTITVLTNDGRAIVGVLKGFDNTTNIVLGDCKERVFSVEAGVETVDLGLYIVRGDNMCVGVHAAAWVGGVGAPYQPSTDSTMTPGTATLPRARHTLSRTRHTPVRPPHTRPPAAPTPRSAVIGEVDTASDGAINWEGVTGEPLKPIVHGMQ